MFAFLMAPLIGCAVGAGGGSIQGPDGLPVAGYKDGFFLQSSERDYALRLNGRVLLRYYLQVPAENPGTARRSSFSLPRVRLRFSGHAYTPELKYAIHIAFDRGDFALKDGLLNYALMGDGLEIRGGQFKMPFSRQNLTANRTLHFTERAITDTFTDGRSIGLMAHNSRAKKKRFEWAFGVFNGATEPATGDEDKAAPSNEPDTLRPTFVARLAYNHGRMAAYSEGDLQGGGLRFGVGTSGSVAFDLQKTQYGHLRANVDAIVKAYGFCATAAVFISSRQQDPRWESQTLHKVGARASASFLIGELVLPAVRYAVVTEVDTPTLHEVRGGVSVLFFEHRVKTIAEFGALISDIPDDPSAELEFTAQIQVAF